MFLDLRIIADALIDRPNRLVLECRHCDWNLVNQQFWRISVATGVYR